MSNAALILSLLMTASAGDDLAQTDNMSIARLLFSDGFYDRAAVVLDQVDPAATEVDAKELWLLRGLVELNRGRHTEAADFLKRAIDAGNDAPKLYLLRAQALSNSQQLAAAEEALKTAPLAVRQFPEAFVLHARVLYQLEHKHASFAVLDAGLTRFPDHLQMERQRMFLLMELGLYRAAQDAMKRFFDRHDSTPKDHVALAEALRQGGQLDRARLLLEQANLSFPYEPDIRSQLAVTYLDLGQPVIAAEVLRPLAWLDEERAMHTAELYRKGGAFGRATRMNQRVADQKAKFRQRLGLLLEVEAFEQAASLYPRVARLGLLEEQSIVYAMAYAFFQTREFDEAEELLVQLTDERLFQQGIAIRRAIEDCKRAAWQCD